MLFLTIEKTFWLFTVIWLIILSLISLLFVLILLHLWSGKYNQIYQGRGTYNLFLNLFSNGLPKKTHLCATCNNRRQAGSGILPDFFCLFSSGYKVGHLDVSSFFYTGAPKAWLPCCLYLCLFWVLLAWLYICTWVFVVGYRSRPCFIFLMAYSLSASEKHWSVLPPLSPKQIPLFILHVLQVWGLQRSQGERVMSVKARLWGWQREG